MFKADLKMLGNLSFEKEVETFLEEYLYKVFNVDYRTLEKDTKWKAFMSELTHDQIGNTTFADNIMYSYYEGINVLDEDGESDVLTISPLLYHCYYDGNVSHVGLDNVVLGKWRENPQHIKSRMFSFRKVLQQ